MAADWEVDLEGALNLDHPKAKAAGLEDRAEPVKIKFYALHHPKHETYLIDTGVARSIAQRSDDMPVGSMTRSALNFDALRVHVDTKTWLERTGKKPRGVQWGWKNGVEPGSFNTDGDAARSSLQALEALAHDRPHLGVHVGHQGFLSAPPRSTN